MCCNRPFLWMTICLPLYFLYACTNDKKNTTSITHGTKSEIDKIEKQGIEARENGQFDKAIELHFKQLEMGRQIGDTNIVVSALNHIGTNYRRLGALDKAAHYHFAALLRTENDLDNQTVLRNHVRSLNGLGNIYLTLGKYQQADSIFRRALKGERQLDNVLGQAINLANIGSLKEELGENDSAWTYYKYALTMNRQAKSYLGESLCFSHFARLHVKEGNLEEAIKEYQHAYDAMSESRDDWHKLDTRINMSELYLRLGKLEEARELLEKAKERATDIHSIGHLEEIHILYYKLYEQEGNTRAALDNYIRSVQLRDSIVNDKKKEEIHNMRLNLERSQQEDKLNEMNRQYQDERQARMTLSLILLLLTLIAIGIILGLWYTLRERTKTQHILQQMNKSKEDFFASIAIDPAEIKSADTIISEQDRQFLGRFVDIVYSQMTKGKADVESVAEQMNLSRAQLNRRIMAITGQNTMGYITQIRISKAKRLLRADNITPIGDIAIKCGFDDVAYFSRLFKQHTNMTPSQYRKMI